jgi:DNA-binding NarL/FixJ family response regulator
MAKRIVEPLGAVLVVEDFPVVREGLAKFLKDRMGARTVSEAAGFGDAMIELEKQSFNLAILDLGIPGLTGPRELAQLRRRWPRMKLVVLSGSTSRADILASLEAGAHGYFVKTASMENLANRLGEVMAGEIRVPASLADLDKYDGPPITGAGQGGGRAGDAHASRALLARLTARQREVLALLVEGLANRDIANRLGRSESMAKTHVAAVIKALGARSRTHAAAIARKLLGDE